MWSGNFKTAVSSLRLSKWRTIFTMMGIIIGVSSVVTVVSLGEGLKHQISGQINQLGSNVITVRPGKLVSKQGGLGNLNLYAFLAPSTLTTKDVESLKSLPVVNNVVPIEFVTNVASGDNGELDDVFVAGSTPNLGDVLHQKIAYGSFFSAGDSDQNFAVVGSDIAAKLFGVLNPVGSTVHINGQDFIVRGVLSPSSGGLLSIAEADYNSSIFIPTSAAESLTSGHTSILQILVQTKAGSNIDSNVSLIKKSIAKNHGGTVDFTVLKQNELLGVSNQVLNTVTSFISGIAAISLLVGGIGIMNIMLVSVSERTREIGIRKAIGATNRQILNQFLIEGLVLSIGGGIIGILASLLINLLLRLYSSWHPLISVWVLILAVVVSVAFGIIFSV
ncbi:MAG TPA: ABC transporter permease, partial [Candidatus Saccharimonadales bacterium]|nr:ABC transporter permease [Candidatus Saccharimonadales bacterium]